MKRLRLPRARFAISSVLLLTALVAVFIRIRVTPPVLTIEINPNGGLARNETPIAALEFERVLNSYRANQNWWLSKSALRIRAPREFDRKRAVQDSLDFVTLSALYLEFDRVSLDWYAADQTSTSNDFDPALGGLLYDLKRAEFP